MARKKGPWWIWPKEMRRSCKQDLVDRDWIGFIPVGSHLSRLDRIYPEGIKAVSPRSLRSSAPGVVVDESPPIPKGSQHGSHGTSVSCQMTPDRESRLRELAGHQAAIPSGSGFFFATGTPGAPLRGDLGLTAENPTGSRRKPQRLRSGLRVFAARFAGEAEGVVVDREGTISEGIVSIPKG
jgi:hypothetical protein